jgi:hypothetical protein
MASSAGSKANSSAASLGVAPGWGCACNPRFAFFANHLHPLPDRPRGNIQGFRDFFVGPSRVLEFHGAIPTLLFPIYVASTFFVHARSLSITRYEGNLSMQRSIGCHADHLRDEEITRAGRARMNDSPTRACNYFSEKLYKPGQFICSLHSRTRVLDNSLAQQYFIYQ